jgi:hypothetical protein
MPRIVHIAIKVDDLEKRPTFTAARASRCRRDLSRVKETAATGKRWQDIPA